MTIKTYRILVLSLMYIVFSTNVFAIDAQKVPKNKQSTTGLYFTAKEASDHVAKNSKSTLFVDIRDPAEVFTVGMPSSADKVVPFKRLNLKGWNKKKSTFALAKNPDFSKMISTQLKAKKLTNNDTIILICGSGKRAAKAASALKKSGFTKVYSVIDGYKGWQKSKLKWSKKLDKNKISL